MDQKSSFTQIIEAGSAEELKQKVQELAQVFGVGTTAPTTPVPPVVAAPAAKEAPKSTPTKTTKGTKSAKPVAAEPVEEEDVPEQSPTAAASGEDDEVDPFADDEEESPTAPVAIPAKPTFDDIRSVTEKISESKGVQAVRELVAQFGEKKISAVKEKDYVKFLEAANKKLAE